MNKAKWITFGIICLAILGAVIFMNKQEATTFNGDSSKPITEGPIADHIFGSKENKVVLVEYGDFQCPACFSVFPAVKDIKDTYGDKLTFVFRNLPLTNNHPNALAAATAAEAAGLQGKFYEMHDMLYENQQSWANVDVSERGKAFESFAQQLGLDINKFKNDLSSKDISDKINRDRTTAKQIEANSTPTFMLNGQKLPDSTAVNAEALKQAIKEALQQAGYKLD